MFQVLISIANLRIFLIFRMRSDEDFVPAGRGGE